MAHSIPIYLFRYEKTALSVSPVPTSVEIFSIGYGDDGTVFGMAIGVLGTATPVSLLCIRLAACLWLRYRVNLLAIGPPSAVGTTTAAISTDMVLAIIERQTP
jgi:hypothetical protein